MMPGENISVSDEAMPSRIGRSRTKLTYASTAKRVPVQPDAFGELQPAFDAAGAGSIAVMVDDAPAPFPAQLRRRQLRQGMGVLDRDHRLVIVAVQRPRLDLRLRQLAAVQQLVERMQMMIALGADGAQRRFEFVGPKQAIALFRLHGLTSMPS
jgi:hypothetical protein